MEDDKEMTLVDALVIISIFGGFGLLMWGRLVKRNHPIVDKIKQLLSKPKERMANISEQDKWQQPNIDKKIF